MSSAGTRSRSLPHFLNGGHCVIRDKKSLKVSKDLGTATQQSLSSGTQKTVSESHRYDYKHGHYDGGGPFYTVLDDYHWNDPIVNLQASRDASSEYFYSGPLHVAIPSLSEIAKSYGGTWSPPSSEDFSDLDADGAVAVSLASPINPVANLGVGLSESYKEGLPSLPGVTSWRSRAAKAKAASGEFLNAEFGWLPLVSEINDVVYAARHHRDIMNQYHRDEGSNVRRDFSFPVSVSSQTFVSHGLQPTVIPPPGTENSLQNANVLGKWKRTVTRKKSDRRWFKGSFTYGLPSSTDSWRRALGFGSEADKLFGLALTPDILWELTPWSWAVDWFTNAGQVINNVTNFELAGQVMRYGYMMDETIDEIDVTYTLESPPIELYQVNRKSLENVSVTAKRTITSKRRSPANPFGFGLTSSDLSPTQLLIAAAVGITLL